MFKRITQFTYFALAVALVNNLPASQYGNGYNLTIASYSKSDLQNTQVSRLTMAFKKGRARAMLRIRKMDFDQSAGTLLIL